MIYLFSRLIFTVFLSLHVIQRRHAFVLSTCTEQTEGDNSQPEILKQLEMAKTMGTTDEEGAAVSRPQCDKKGDEVVSQLAKHFVNLTTETPTLQKRFLLALGPMFALGPLGLIAGAGYLVYKASGRKAEFPSMQGGNTKNDVPVPPYVLTWHGYVKEALRLYEKTEGAETNTVRLCILETLKYFEGALNTTFDKEVIKEMRGYQTTLDKLNKKVEKFCTKCNVTEEVNETAVSCRPTCDLRYNKPLEEFYTKIKSARQRIMTKISQEWWSAYFLKATCNVQFLVAAEIAAVSKDRDEANYNLFRDSVRKDATDCLNMMSNSVDSAFRNSVRNTAANRAFIYREFREWLDTFDTLSGIKNIGTGETKLKLSIGQGLNIGGSSKGWLSCKESALEWLCGGNVTDDNTGHGDWMKCKPEDLMTMKKVTDSTSDGDIIMAMDNVYLFSQNTKQVYWDVAEDSDCPSDRLVYKTAADGQLSDGKGSYVIKAWDWTGRQREKGEEIYDHDYVVLDFVNPPENESLTKRGLSVKYIEGFLFLTTNGTDIPAAAADSD